MALWGTADSEVRSALVAMGVDALARESKVSIARFVRLVGLLSEASRSRQALRLDDGPHDDASGAAAGELCGVSVMLAFVWATAHNKSGLLQFLTAHQRHAPHLTVFATSAAPECDAWRARFLADAFGDEACIHGMDRIRTSHRPLIEHRPLIMDRIRTSHRPLIDL